MGYELHPETPPGGVPLDAYLPDAAGARRYVKSFAARFGLEIDPPARIASTRRALAAAQAARELGKLDAFRAAAFDAYWRGGSAITSDDEIAALARAAGLETAPLVAAAGDAARLAEVDAARARATAEGVMGIPTFDFLAGGEDRGLRVVGCQPLDVLAEAARRAGATRRTRTSPAPRTGSR